jgi:hypothetical protein
MNKLVRIESEIIKTDDGELFSRKLKKLNRDLDKLAPGIYTMVIERRSDRMDKLKKYYFTMETNLGLHLGMHKDEIHKATKTVAEFMKPNQETGDMEYDSVAKIKDEDEMLARIAVFQEWSAREFQYTHEPFKEEAK